jgi:hypothetical protein
VSLETGEFEKELEDHKHSMDDMDFDSKDNLLGEPGLLRSPCPGLRSDQVTCSSDLFTVMNQLEGH